MVIEKLEINDDRSCIDAMIESQPDLCVLIGPNGSGKTNVLNACLLLRALASESDMVYRASGDDPMVLASRQALGTTRVLYRDEGRGHGTIGASVSAGNVP